MIRQPLVSCCILLTLLAAPVFPQSAAPKPAPAFLSLSFAPGLTYPLAPGMAYFAPGLSAELAAGYPLPFLPALSARGTLRYDFTPLQAGAGSASQVALLAGGAWRFPLPWGLSARAFGEAGYSFGAVNGDAPWQGGGSPVLKAGGGAALPLASGLSAALDAYWIWYLGSWGGFVISTGLAWDLPPAPAKKPVRAAPAPSGDAPVSVFPRRLLLGVEADPGGPFTPEETLAASKALSARLASAGAEYGIVEPDQALLPLSVEQRAAAARKTGARGWLLVQLIGDRDSPQARVTAFDLIAQKPVEETRLALAGGPGLLDAPRQDWSAVVSLASAAFPDPAAPAAEIRKPRTAHLRLRGAPHTSVSGLPGGVVNLGDRGFAAVELPAPSTYVFHAASSGYRPVAGRVYLGEDTEVPLKQEPRSWWRLDASFQNALFPGVDASIFFLERAFIQIGATSYQFGLAASGSQVFFSYPLLEGRLLAGWYPFPEDWPLRPYAAAGAFIRWVYPSGQSLQLDTVAPLGVEASLGADILLSDRARLFMEYVPMGYFTAYPGVLHSATSAEVSAPGYVNFRWGAISLLNARFGLRWYL